MAMLLFFCTGIAFAETSDDFALLKIKLRQTFPEVVSLSVEEFKQELRSNPSKIVIIDSRAREEYEVSHLDGAVLFVPKVDSLKSLVEKLPMDKAIITYCSVGYRSSKLAEQLMAKGFSNVRSLEGGIFEWANHNNAVFSGSKQVKYVHPFNKAWGRFLNNDLHPPAFQ